MSYIFTFLLVLLASSTATAQEFERIHSKSIQPVLSQPLQWVMVPSVAAPSLPEAFAVNPDAWAFAPYTSKTVLPTGTGRDAWLKFTLAATPTPQSWVIRIPRLTVKKVSLHDMNTNGSWPVQSAGTSIAHSAWNRSTRAPSFEVLTSNTEKSYFLRFEHYIPITERPELVSQTDFADAVARLGTLLGLMFGMFGMLMMACTAAFVVARNKVFLSLAVFVATVLLHYLVQIGFGGWRLWPDSAYLNQAMQWTAPLLAMAACCWFFAHASHAKDISKPVHHLLILVALVSLGLGLFGLINVDQIERIFLMGWAVFVLLVIIVSLLWLSLRGMRLNFWLLAGFLPIAAASAARMAYSYGWLAHMEFALTVSVFMSQIGLAWIFVALIWRSRAVLLASELAAALNNLDTATGLIQKRIALIHLPRMLRRATQLKLGCGVIMLRWLNYRQLMGKLSPEIQIAMLKQLGLVLNRVARDIDTAACMDDGDYMILVEGPISRSTLSSLSTQILTACIRASDKFGLPNSFSFHVAIWQAPQGSISANEVMETLKTRLDQMSFGTKRPVQFVDAAASNLTADRNNELAQRRDALMAKIDAIEASTSMQALLMSEKLKN